jgi:hypothetical protein
MVEIGYIVIGVQLQRMTDMMNYARVRNENKKAVFFYNNYK